MAIFIGVVAVMIAIVGLTVAVGNAGYLALLNHGAKKHGEAGAPVGAFVKSKLPLAVGAAGIGLVALLLTTGGIIPDVIALVLGIACALIAWKSLDATRARYPDM